MKVIIYSKPNCPACTKAKALAERKGHEVEYLSFGKNFDAGVMLREFPNARTFPQIIVDGEKIGGYVELEKLLEG
tara:strand:- start:2648 stop:2872 length:225 start_codon:yes stop_codon:yes gene_type:complete